MTALTPRPSQRQQRPGRGDLHVQERTPPEHFRPSARSQPASPSIPWADLATAAPGFLDFERAAREAAANRWAGWPEWVARYGTFWDAIRNAADHLGLPLGIVRGAAVAHLVEIFRESWHREWPKSPVPADKR